MGLYWINMLLLFFSLLWLFPFSLPAHSATTTVSFPTGYQNRVAVLMYHHISDTVRGTSVITPQLFREHLDMLQRKGYHVISTERLAQFLAGKATVPPRAVALTFDDGYESFYTYAYPELKKRNISGHLLCNCQKGGGPKGKDTQAHLGPDAGNASPRDELLPPFLRQPLPGQGFPGLYRRPPHEASPGRPHLAWQIKPPGN